MNGEGNHAGSGQRGVVSLHMRSRGSGFFLCGPLDGGEGGTFDPRIVKGTPHSDHGKGVLLIIE